MAQALKKLWPDSPRRYFRFGVNVFFFVLGFIFGSWASRIPDIQSALGLNDAELGTALFAAPLAQLPTMFAAGFLVKRFGSRKVLAVGLLLYALSLVFLGLAASLWQLFAVLLVFGMSGNLFDIAVNTQAVGVEKIYKRSIMGSVHGLWSMGGVAGGLLGALLASFYISPFVHFASVFVISLLLFLLLIRWTLPRDLFSAQSGPPAARKGSLRAGLSAYRPDALLLLLGLVAFANMSVEGIMYDWSSVYFAGPVKAPVSMIRFGYIACMSASVCGRFIADPMISRYGPARVLQASGLLIAVGFAVLIAWPELLPATVGAAVIGFGMAAGVPICVSLAGKSRRIPPSIAISMVAAISFSGFLMCPPIIRHLSYAFDLRIAFIPVGCLGLIIFSVSPLLGKRR